jgi:hypothetical protein
VALSHRVGSEPGSAAHPRDDPLRSPPATRGRRSRWADPRLWAGVLLVLASLVVGARVFAAADDTVAVWAMSHDAVAGSRISSRDVRRAQVHFDDAAQAQRYLSATAPLSAAARLTRDVGAGELLATSAVSAGRSGVRRQLPLGVAASGVPAGLSPGDRVDVWAVPSSDSPPRRPPANALHDVTVTAVSGAGLGGLGGDRQILVSLPAGTDVGAVLATLDGSSVVLIKNGG